MQPDKNYQSEAEWTQDLVRFWLKPGIMEQSLVIAAVILILPILLLIGSIWARSHLKKHRHLRRRNPLFYRLLNLVASLTNPSTRHSFKWLQRRRKSRNHRTKYNLSGDPASSDVVNCLSVNSGARQKTASHSFSRGLDSPDVSWPFYAQDELAAVSRVLKSTNAGLLNGGTVASFEASYGEALGYQHAIAVASGSVALELALRGLQAGAGDEVIVAARTEVASVNAIRFIGATPVFVDVDRTSGTMGAAAVSQSISQRTRAIVVTHFGGWPANIMEVVSLARSRGIAVIEDCADAHGARIDGHLVGSIGDAAAFSFSGDRIITTGGEGGLVFFRDRGAYEWAWSFANHGMSRLSPSTGEPTSAPRVGLNRMIGTNWRMMDLAAAIGIAQLPKLTEWCELRFRNAGIWADALSRIPNVRAPMPGIGAMGAFYRFYAYLEVDHERKAKMRDEIVRVCTEQSLRVSAGLSSGIYHSAAFSGLLLSDVPIAKELAETSLAFEVHPNLNVQKLRSSVDRVTSIIESVMQE